MLSGQLYAGFPARGFILYRRQLSEVLRAWLGYVPEKVLFGTDAFPFIARGELGRMDLLDGARRAAGLGARADRHDQHTRTGRGTGVYGAA